MRNIVAMGETGFSGASESKLTGAEALTGKSGEDGTPEICTTAGCVQAAANLLSALDQSVDPCEDFYNYACGKWNRDNPIPDDMSGFGTFNLIIKRVRQQMRGLRKGRRKRLA